MLLTFVNPKPISLHVCKQLVTFRHHIIKIRSHFGDTSIFSWVYENMHIFLTIFGKTKIWICAWVSKIIPIFISSLPVSQNYLLVTFANLLGRLSPQKWYFELDFGTSEHIFIDHIFLKMLKICHLTSQNILRAPSKFLTSRPKFLNSPNFVDKFCTFNHVKILSFGCSRARFGTWKCSRTTN